MRTTGVVSCGMTVVNAARFSWPPLAPLRPSTWAGPFFGRAVCACAAARSA